MELPEFVIRGSLKSAPRQNIGALEQCYLGANQLTTVRSVRAN